MFVYTKSTSKRKKQSKSAKVLQMEKDNADLVRKLTKNCRRVAPTSEQGTPNAKVDGFKSLPSCQSEDSRLAQLVERRILVPQAVGSSPTSAAIPSGELIPTNGGYKKSVDDYRWKSGRQETKETIDAIELKKKSIAPAYNKGPAMLITDKRDWKTAGRKV